MILDQRENEAKRYDQFLLMLHANPMTDTKARESYMRSIEPMAMRQANMGKMETDFDQLRAVKAQLEQERK